MSSAINVMQLQPGFRLSAYPESIATQQDVVQRYADRLSCAWRTTSVRRRSLATGRRIAERLDAIETSLSFADIAELRVRLVEEGWRSDVLEEALALVGMQVRQHFGFTPHPEQFAGAWALLHGTLIEMATGEGKTITAAMAAVVAGLSGAAVHVITTNEYLVARDAESMRPLYDAFALTSGYVLQEQEDEQRRAGYEGDICYVTNKLVVFDYLRDRQLFGRNPASLSVRLRDLGAGKSPAPLLRGLCFAIVDEADSALIDDAVTPLILSYQRDEEPALVEALTALSLADRLESGRDYDVEQRQVRLTDTGRESLGALVADLEGVWTNARYCEERTQQALMARHVFKKDVDYLVQEGQVVLIDQSTGRLLPDRKLQNGLHQLIEVAEQCELSRDAQTVASLSFQKFFTRYTVLAAMTGTAWEARRELRTVYGLGVVPIPTHRRSRRANLGARFAATEAQYLDQIVSSVQQQTQRGRPVLIGTRSLAHSEYLSRHFSAHHIEHDVLNARQDQDEAERVAKAGQRAQVTIATNMAGRGTDIPIGDEVRAAGGLHVIVAQLNDSPRIDRQLIGRCSRQGDPGSYEFVVGPDDPVWAVRSHPLLALNRWSWARSLMMRRARRRQESSERQQRRLRRDVARHDELMQQQLAFTGYKE